MGIIKDKKLKRTKEQKYPLSPSGNTSQETNKFDIDEETIKKQQNKK